jgi:hypothetical protein
MLFTQLFTFHSRFDWPEIKRRDPISVPMKSMKRLLDGPSSVSKQMKVKTKTETKIEQSRSDFPLCKIISGGQSGADRGALESAEILGIATGGTAPIGFYTINGKCPELGSRFHLVELSTDKNTPLSVMYVERSKKNVDDCDGTIAFRLKPSVGTDKTIGYCLTKSWRVMNNFETFDENPYRPLLVITDLSKYSEIDNVARIQGFINQHSVKVLNVCGHRDGKEMGFDNFEQIVRNILIKAILPCLYVDSLE